MFFSKKIGFMIQNDTKIYKVYHMTAFPLASVSPFGPRSCCSAWHPRAGRSGVATAVRFCAENWDVVRPSACGGRRQEWFWVVKHGKIQQKLAFQQQKFGFA